MKVTNEHLVLLKKYGFMWYKDKSTDRVEADCIRDVIPAANGFTVLYNEKAVLLASTAVVNEIDIPEDPDKTWILVKWESIVDERR